MIMDELNVESVVFNILQSIYGSDESVILETDLKKYPNLKLKGQARELVRVIQGMRKEAGYEVDNHIKIGYVGGQEVFTKFGDLIAKETLANDISVGELAEADLQKEVLIDEVKYVIFIKRD